MANSVQYFEVLGKDGNALRSFYSELFGWTINTVDGPMDYGMVEAGDGIPGGIGAAQESDGHVTVYVAVDDIDAALAKAESLGGKTVVPPMDVPNGPRIALFHDPEGHTIGLFVPVPGMEAMGQ